MVTKDDNSKSRKQAVQVTPNVVRGRIYPIESAGTKKFVAREIAALDFLIGIPMSQEPAIVRKGCQRNQQAPTGKWWEKFVHRTPRRGSGESFLEQPGSNVPQQSEVIQTKNKSIGVVQSRVSGGRRLDGDNATKVKIPRSGFARTRQRSIARQAAIREWELRVAHGLQDDQTNGMLDGRVFFSSRDNYPVGVFSVVRYEPKREEAARRRKKLEARGGGGTQFIVPERDWRGTSYRALLPKVEAKDETFNRFLTPPTDDSEDLLQESDDEADLYIPGFLDDPEMVQGRHRNVMIGDRVTGCIVSSAIQFVKPADLKADLNKQFRERFDRWEPPKAQWKFIGAKVVNGVYTLFDPAEVESRSTLDGSDGQRRQRELKVSSQSDVKETRVRMPPSLTLSKIRSVKQQALMASVAARLEVSTVALACVYFERLCLDCRVDKSNRRLSFAASLLLAAKINEAHVGLVMRRGTEEVGTEEKGMLSSKIKPTNQSHNIFASLLEFFTHEWELSLDDLFSAEWGVFVALGFSLNATPSQVTFHFRRLMKTLGWKTRSYLGSEMYDKWQLSLLEEENRRKDKEKRQEIRRNQKERNLLKLELQRQQENESNGSAEEEEEWPLGKDIVRPATINESSEEEVRGQVRKGTTLGLLNRFSIKRQLSVDRLNRLGLGGSSHHSRGREKKSEARNRPAATLEVKEDSGSHESSVGVASGDEAGLWLS